MNAQQPDDDRELALASAMVLESQAVPEQIVSHPGTKST
jgi:hypothetical protein